MTYKESAKKLDKIRQEYGCKGEIIFRTAIQHVVDYGKFMLTDEGWYECFLFDINKRHDEAEKENKHLFMTRDFEKAILDCAAEICSVDTYDLLKYIQKEVWLNGEGIEYQRAIQLVQRCVNWITNEVSCGDAYDDLISGIGFDELELEELGYGYLLDIVEEDE